VSLVRALSGLLAALLVGLPLGLLLGGWFPRIQTATEPLMELFAQANPVILAHIIIFFLGIGQSAKIFIIAWLCIWPITFSTISGIRNVDPTLIKSARSLGLGRFRLFVSVVLPSAAASIFTGLRLAAGYAYIMLIASEMMGASSGLGFLVVQSQESYNVTRIFAGASVITLLAVVTDQLLKLAERRLAFREDGDAEDYVRMRQVTQGASL
jgi:NitT/TauT family transport system permease protein